MAQRVETILIDDIDGSSAAETVNFALDRVNYVIDLNSENASRLRADLQEWINYARRARNGRRRTTTPAVSNSESRRMREWAKEHGFQVSDRGRVSAEIRQAYLAEQGR